MIDRVGGVFVLVCDVCGEATEEEFDYFYDAVEHKAKNGWKNQRDKNGHWEDVCPECVGVE